MELKDRIAESFGKQRFLSTIGARLETVEPGRVTISCGARADLTQQDGFMHAGVIATVADVACGYAAMSLMGEDYRMMSVEFKLNMLRPMAGARVLATGRVVKPGKTLFVTEAEVRDADSGKLIAQMLGTMIAVKATED